MKKSINFGTVIAAARWQDKTGVKIVIGADTQITVGNHHMHTDPCSPTGQKLAIFGTQLVVGVSGIGPIREVLLDMQRDKNISFNFDGSTEDDFALTQFGQTVFTAFREKWEKSPHGVNIEDAVDNVGDLIMVTPFKIYTMYTDFNLLVLPSYTASGCGAEFALGSMANDYRELSKLKSVSWDRLHGIVQTGLEIACEHSVYCSRPLTIVEMRVNGTEAKYQ